ncbi:MAG: histidine phosphatase family protein [Cystobacterineae bacterium]|nr:histidine phosphatase family protein [Cystobacterineae bacterium]
MKAYLIRHGDADAEVPEGLGDEERALTTKGRLSLASHFSVLAPRMAEVELILFSPLVRCVQTAQLLSMAIGYEGTLRPNKALLPDMPVGAIESLLAGCETKAIALVGHQPAMGALASHLLGLEHFPKPFIPGTVVGIQLELAEQPSRGSLLFFAQPGQSSVEKLF